MLCKITKNLYVVKLISLFSYRLSRNCPLLYHCYNLRFYTRALIHLEFFLMYSVKYGHNFIL